MQIDLRTVSITPLRQTYQHIAERQGADKPASRYIEATMDVQPQANFHYRPTWQPEHELFDAGRTRIVMQDWYRVLTLVAMMMDYMLPKRVMSWKEAWEIYGEQNGGALFADLARYGTPTLPASTGAPCSGSARASPSRPTWTRPWPSMAWGTKARSDFARRA